MAYDFQTVDVFTDTRFCGNPLAVFVDARGMDGATMQALATEMNLSETTFVLPPEDPANDTRVRIFHRTAEMAFAGHPLIGTAFVLASLGRAKCDHLRFEVPAGVVVAELLRHNDGSVTGARITAPQALSTGTHIAPDMVAACLGLEPHDIITTNHAPLIVSMGNPYVLAEVKLERLKHCAPDIAAFHRALAAYPNDSMRFSIHAYAHDTHATEPNVMRARMFAPLVGTWEDPATGSANAPLAGFLLQLSGKQTDHFTVHQGVEMGRPSLLHMNAAVTPDGIQASVAGQCVPMLRGSIDL